jgi:hypothetical protein
VNKVNKVNKKITEDMLEKLTHKDQVRFALFCVEQVVELGFKSKEILVVVDVLNRFLEGKATKKDCKVVANIAWVAADAADAYTAAAYAAATV